MRSRFLLVLIVLFSGIGCGASPYEKSDSESHVFTLQTVNWDEFLSDPDIRRSVDFWVKIYSKYKNSEGIIHDSKYLEIIYETVNLEGLNSHEVRRKVLKARTYWRDVLMSVHRKKNTPEKMNEVEKSVFLMYADVQGSNKFLEATQKKRIRFQKGQRDSFLSALEQSGKYLEMMEQVFREEGLPVELTRLPFVESSFNLHARSKVGASGIWQFMRSTGRLFLIVNPVIDERNDPIFATRAAARLLRQNYEALRAWPLAIVAYNHGRMGMMRAVRSIGSTEIKDILGQHRSRGFGFASKSFFMEFLAAVVVERNAALYFGELKRASPYRFAEVTLPDFVQADDLISILNVGKSDFFEYNPALTDLVSAGKKLIPAEFRIRIPILGANTDKSGVLKAFWDQYGKLPATKKHRSQR